MRYLPAKQTHDHPWSFGNRSKSDLTSSARFSGSLWSGISVTSWERVGAVGSWWEQLGAGGSGWELLGAVGSCWEPVEAVGSR